jgi:hypothetical protein
MIQLNLFKLRQQHQKPRSDATGNNDCEEYCRAAEERSDNTDAVTENVNQKH